MDTGNAGTSTPAAPRPQDQLLTVSQPAFPTRPQTLCAQGPPTVASLGHLPPLSAPIRQRCFSADLSAGTCGHRLATGPLLAARNPRASSRLQMLSPWQPEKPLSPGLTDDCSPFRA